MKIPKNWISTVLKDDHSGVETMKNAQNDKYLSFQDIFHAFIDCFLTL